MGAIWREKENERERERERERGRLEGWTDGQIMCFEHRPYMYMFLLPVGIHFTLQLNTKSLNHGLHVTKSDLHHNGTRN